MAEPAFQGKTVLITGADGGLGRCLVAGFAQAGARVIAATRDGRAVESAAAAIALQIDVTDPASIKKAAEAAGAVDILVNNAGVNGNGRMFGPNAVKDAAAEMAVNYFGMMNMVHAFAPGMQARRSGAIVNILSILAHANLPLCATYSASKAAAWSLTQAARAELARFGIRVHAIFPPVLDTAMASHIPGPKMSPQDAAIEILEALREGREDAFLGAAKDGYARVRENPKAVEAAMASRLPS
jgi:NAD(P)-dependent dehydrogenase (short-subunit alcohol dehydrogenase family)